VARYLDALEQANLVYRLPPAGTGGKKVLKARFKFYLVDAALRNAVLLRGREILNDPGEMGTIVKTMVLRHVYAYHYPDAPQIVYWRDAKTGKEVDIIVKSPRYVMPVEVKYRERTTFGEKEGLVSYCRAEKIGRACWITQQSRDFGVVQVPGLDTRFLKIPAHIFAYLIGRAERLLWES
jgi:predicted AAA+ superfamily ATPase